MNRERFGSRLGFLLVSAGCAIGIGNVWRFPYIVGQNGGGFFVLLYLVFLLILGVPVLTMELAMGRASRKSVVQAYKQLEGKKGKWHLHGWVCVVGCYMLMMYYTTVSGWMTDYFIKFAVGDFKSDMTTQEVSDVFSLMMDSPVEMGLWTAFIIIAGFLVCSKGLKGGIEKISKFMMGALLLLIIVLAINSILLKGSSQGLRFYLVPDMDKVHEIGLGKIIVSAMNQAFFTLSLGIASMEIFGSYMSRDNTLPSESLRISALDTFVAFMAGLIIFPACFSYGVEPDSGPSLIFVTLPNVFVNMAGGRIWGALFFLFMTFASFSTVIAVFESLVALLMDNLKMSRVKSSIINCIIVLITSLPCVLGFNVLKGLHIIGDRGVLDSEDYIVSSWLLPLGALVFLLFCTLKWGWGFEKYLEECNTGKGSKFPKFFKPYFRFILPLLIAAVFVTGIF